MEDTRAHLNRYGKLIQVILIILQVFTILGVVIGAIMIFVLIFSPDVLEDLQERANPKINQVRMELRDGSPSMEKTGGQDEEASQ